MTPSLSPGQRFADKYTLRKLLATASDSQTWLAVDIATGARVVLKIFSSASPRLAHLASVRPSLADVKARGLLTDFALYAEGSEPYLCMEYFKNHSIGDTKIPFTRDELIDMLRQGAEALSALHAASLVHGNIKPSNMLLRKDGEKVEVVLSDIALHEGIDADSSADIAALGRSLLSAASGGDTTDFSHITDPGLRVLLEACLDPDPSRRPKANVIVAAIDDGDVVKVLTAEPETVSSQSVAPPLPDAPRPSSKINLAKEETPEPPKEETINLEKKTADQKIEAPAPGPSRKPKPREPKPVVPAPDVPTPDVPLPDVPMPDVEIDTDQNTKPKSGSKKWIWLLLLVCAAAAVWYFCLRTPTPSYDPSLDNIFIEDDTPATSTDPSEETPDIITVTEIDSIVEVPATSTPVTPSDIDNPALSPKKPSTVSEEPSPKVNARPDHPKTTDEPKKAQPAPKKSSSSSTSDSKDKSVASTPEPDANYISDLHRLHARVPAIRLIISDVNRTRQFSTSNRIQLRNFVNEALSLTNSSKAAGLTPSQKSDLDRIREVAAEARRTLSSPFEER